MSRFKHDEFHFLNDPTRTPSRPHSSNPFQIRHGCTQFINFLGTPPSEQKPEHTYHLFCVNPNGITMTTTHIDFNEICYTLISYSVDTACINEHNLDTHKHSAKQQIYQACHCQYHHTKVSMASMKTSFNNHIQTQGYHDVLPRTGHSSYHTPTHRPVGLTVLPNIQLQKQHQAQSNHSVPTMPVIKL